MGHSDHGCLADAFKSLGGLNPCSNGWGTLTYIAATMSKIMIVLILALMDGAL